MTDAYLNKVLDSRYEMLEIIGTGGMAVVYKAKDKKLNRMVAVKILKQEMRADEKVRRNFLAESEAVSKLNQQNIISVLDVGAREDMDYFVMELIDGITLKQYMNQRGAMTPKEAVHFSIQILRALEHAHNRNIIHRDIKPQNVMILRDGTVKVADFGIARIGTGDQTAAAESTFGSVHYMSPEQVRGGDLDGRADVYSVGVMLYEMLTGELPYKGDTPVAIAMQHLSAAPVPPSRINSSVPNGLEWILLKAMNPEPDARSRTAGEMIDDLESFKRDPVGFLPGKIGAEMSGDMTVRYVPVAANAQNSRNTEPVPVVRNGGDGTAAKKKVNLMPVMAALLVLLVLAAGIAALWISILSPSSGGEDVIVDNFVGFYYDDVVRDNSDRFEFVKADERYSSVYAAGIIIDQDRVDGTRVKKGSLIKLTVSKGTLTTLMPNYVNSPFDAAEKQLKQIMENDIIIQRIYETSTTVPKNSIIRTSPLAGLQITAGDTVVFYISSGVEVEEVIMPNLFGYTEIRARELLIGLGLAVGPIQTEKNDAFGPGYVINQSVPGNTKVTKGTEIILTVTSPDSGTTAATTVGSTADFSTATEYIPPVGGYEWTVELPTDSGIPAMYFLEISYADTGELIYSGPHSKSDNLLPLRLLRTGSVTVDVSIDMSKWRSFNIDIPDPSTPPVIPDETTGTSGTGDVTE